METKKVKCHCPCHRNKGIKHVMACCDNGWIEIPISLESQEEVNKISSNLSVSGSLPHDTDDENEDDNWQPCADCDLPDACADFGCAIESGIRKPPQ